MPQITIRDYLADMSPQRPGHDYNLERRLFMADRIRERANTDELGTAFLDFQFNTPNLNARGPQSVDFFFASSQDQSQEAQVKVFREIVDQFMKRLAA